MSGSERATHDDGSTASPRGGGYLRRNPTASFFVLTCALSWGWWTVAAFGLSDGTLGRALAIPGAFGPPIAAAVMTWASGDSLRGWATQVVDWRVAPRWYLVAVGLPAAFVLVGVGGTLAAAGGPLDLSVVPGRLAFFAVSFVVAFFVGGGQEELGWRGFALPRLQETYSAVSASLVIGAVWALWHLPLFLLDAPRNQTGDFLLYAALVVGFSVLLTWCYNSTGGSVLLAMCLHAGVNASGNLLPAPTSAIDKWPLAIDAGMIVGVWLAVLAVVGWTSLGSLSRYGVPDPRVAGVEREG